MDVVCFVPSTYVEGPLHGLCDGGSLDAVVARHVTYLGNGRWRNERLAAEAERGRLKLVERDGKRSADDLTIIEYARKREAFIVSNDRYGDHKMGRGELKKYLKGRLFDYEFLFQTDKDTIAPRRGRRVRGCRRERVFTSPPADEGDGVNWDRKVHADGSSRPWARYAKDQTWGKRTTHEETQVHEQSRARAAGELGRFRFPVLGAGRRAHSVYVQSEL